MRPVVADTSVWAREHQRAVAALLAAAIRANVLAIVSPLTLELLRSARSAAELAINASRYDDLRQIEISPVVTRRAREVQARLSWHGYRGPSAVDLLTAAAAESVDAELWHYDRHFELIAGVTGQPMRRVGE